MRKEVTCITHTHSHTHVQTQYCTSSFSCSPTQTHTQTHRSRHTGLIWNKPNFLGVCVCVYLCVCIYVCGLNSSQMRTLIFSSGLTVLLTFPFNIRQLLHISVCVSSAQHSNGKPVSTVFWSICFQTVNAACQVDLRNVVMVSYLTSIPVLSKSCSILFAPECTVGHLDLSRWRQMI